MTDSVRARIRSIRSPSALLAVALLGTTTPVAAQTCATERVNVDSGGVQALAGSDTRVETATSADGRYVVFSSRAANLVAGDTNGTYDVFLRDRVAGTTERVSLYPSGAQALQASGVSGLGVSANANRIVFACDAQLTANDSNSAVDVYVRDLISGQYQLVSVNVSDTAAGSCYYPAISADGRHVAFSSDRPTLVPGDTNDQMDVFVRDLLLGTTQRVSVSTSGAQGDSDWFGGGQSASTPAVSGDGRFVAFTSAHDDIVPGDTNGIEPIGLDVFVRDLQLGTTTRVSVSTAGVQWNSSDRSSISADGRLVAFESAGGVYVHDQQTGVTELVSRATDGAAAPGARGHISGDGRYVLFSSYASFLAAGDTNDRGDVFLRDLASGITSPVSSAGVLGNSNSFASAISHDGRVLVWSSYATNLVAGDTNGDLDLFASECPLAPFTSFCHGTASACPCANAGAAYSGCANSLATGGARLTASGNASLSADTLVLTGGSMPNSSALYFQGNAQQNGGAGSAFGDGLRCAGGTVVRLATVFNSGGASQYPSGAAPSVSQRGQVAAPGTRTYQIWYRNAAAFCTPSTFNLSNGITVDWQS
jgi:Tol biopolymer transport system component